MDALCDPRAFLSAQEKRAEQLKALGIEEADISDNVIESKKPGGGAPGQPGAPGAGGDKKEDGKKDEKKEGESLNKNQPTQLPVFLVVFVLFSPLRMQRSWSCFPSPRSL